MSKKKKNEYVVNKDDVKLDSFKMYDSSNDDFTKIVDGKKQIEDFNLYDEEE